MIQPLGPAHIWQKLSSFSFSSPSGFAHQLSGSSVPIKEITQNPESLFGSIGNPTGKEILPAIAPLSPFGPHTNILGLDNLSSTIPFKIKAPDKFRDLIINAAQKAGVDINLFNLLVAAESDYNPHLVSKAGAMGLTQLMPETASSLGVKDPFDPQQNLEGGSRYLAQMLKIFGGNLEHALAAYTAGPNAVKRYGGVPPYENIQRYVKKILDQYKNP